MALHSAKHLADYVRQFCRDALPPDDATLWERFVQSNEKEAFEVLLHRHGSMVLACAHRVLSDRSRAEDVFQATFLSLARSRKQIREPKSLASWLYKTAYRLALKSRGRQPPLQALPDEAVSADLVDEEVAWREVKRMLDEELHRLPERLRSPLLLCYLSGLTRDEAARQLGCSFDILKRRLEEGRDLLRARLERRGITGAGLALAVLAPQALQATVALPLVETALALVFRPEITVPAAVASLTITASTITKGFVMKSVLVTLCCVGLGIWGYTEVGNSQEPRQKKKPPQEELLDPAIVIGKESPPEEESFPRADWEQRRRSLENLKKIIAGIHNYEATYTYFPADIRDKADKPLLSWRVAILPFLGKEGEALYKQFKLNEPWDSEHNIKLLAKMPKVYRASIEADNSSHTYYQVFAGTDTPLSRQPVLATGEGGGIDIGGSTGGGAPIGGPPMGGGSGGPPSGLPMGGAAPPMGPGGSESGGPGGFGVAPAPAKSGRTGMAHVTDGTSNTIGVVEAGPSVAWTKPADIPFQQNKPLQLSGPFSNALHVAMMDGTTHALKRGIADQVLKNLISMNDGRVTPAVATLHASLPPETAEERAKLKKKIDENRQLITRYSALQKENAVLWDRINRAVADLDEAESVVEGLKLLIETEEELKKELLKEASAKESRATPKK